MHRRTSGKRHGSFEGSFQLKARSLVIAFLLTTFSMLAFFGAANLVVGLPHAFGSTGAVLVQQNRASCSEVSGNKCTSVSVAFASNVAAGDVIVVAIDTSQHGDSLAFQSMSDSRGFAYTEAAHVCDTWPDCAYVYYTTATAGGADTFTVSLTGGSTAGSAGCGIIGFSTADLYIYEISGVTTLGIGTATGSTSTLSSSGSTSTVSFSTGAFLLAGISSNVYDYNCTPTFTHGSGFTFSPVSTSQGLAEYSTSGVASPTSFGFGIGPGGSYWAEAGIALEPLTATSTTVSCSPSSVAASSSSTCTATVSGATGAVSGETISWSQSGTGSVSFSSSTCTLSTTQCTVDATASSAGSVTIKASYPGDSNNLASSGTSMLSVTSPTLSIAPSNGPAGEAATLSGGSYSFSSTYNYCYEPSTSTASACSSTNQFTTDVSGNIPTGKSATTSGSSNGLVVVSDPSTGLVVASASFTISSSTLAITPVQGPAGTSTTLSGNGYSASYTYNYCYEASTSTATACSNTHQFTSSGSGAIPASQSVTSSRSSSGLVVISDPTSSTVIASATFTITTPSISLSPSSGDSGASVTVTGSGFSINTAISAFTYTGSTPTTQTCTTQTSSATGTFSCTFTVPSSSGSNTVVASGSDVGTITTDTASSTFTIPVVNNSPPKIPPGDTPGILNFTTYGDNSIHAYFVGMIGNGEAIYNIPSINQTLLDDELAHGNFTLFPQAVSTCSIQTNGESLIRVSGFSQMWWGGSLTNSTEFVLGYYESFYTSAQGWPSEPAC